MGIRRLFADERGNSFIEMALVAPLLAVLLFGMVDISRAYSDDLLLEQVAQRTVERIQQSGFEPSHKSTLEAEATAAAGAGSAADVAFVLECNGATQSWTSTCTTGQAYARYVAVSVTRPFTPMFGTKYFPGANDDGTVTLEGEAGIRIQ
ncbi:MAG: TadE/TadG family type IV pilus assembly protein [Sphingomicrobium sp.]